MVSLAIFAEDMNKLANQVSQRIPVLVRTVAQNVVEDVAGGTPVLTGQSSANWKTSIGAPDLTYTMGDNPRAGQQSIDDAKNALAALALGQTVYITNNVPYIVDLNSGSSAKAPAGFVETAIVDALHRSANFNLLIS